MACVYRALGLMLHYNRMDDCSVGNRKSWAKPISFHAKYRILNCYWWGRVKIHGRYILCDNYKCDFNSVYFYFLVIDFHALFCSGFCGFWLLDGPSKQLTEKAVFCTSHQSVSGWLEMIVFEMTRLRPMPVLGISIGPIPVVSVWYRYRRYCSRYQNRYQSAVKRL